MLSNNNNSNNRDGLMVTMMMTFVDASRRPPPCQVLLLAPNGELAYAGPPALAAPYFEALGFRRLPSENPADWLMDIVAGRAPRELGPGTCRAAAQRAVAGGQAADEEASREEATGHLAALEDSLDLPELWRGSGSR